MNDLVLHKHFTTPKNDITIENSGGKSIQEFLEYLKIPEELYSCLHVYVGEIYVEQGMYKFVRPKSTTPVKVIIIPQGDDNQMFAMIAMIGLSIVAPQIGLAAFPAGGFGAAAVTIGITIAGSLLINAIFPPPTAPEYAEGEEGSAALTIAGSRNSFPYDKPVQRIYGTVKNYPPHAAQPYTVSEGGDQYLYMLFDLGYGPISVTDLKIGETVITDYQEVEYNVIEAVRSSLDLRYFTGDIDNETINVTLNDGDPETIRTTSTEFKYAQFDLIFSSGLFGLDAEGGTVSETITFNTSHRNDIGNLITADVTLVSYATGVTFESITATDFKISSSLKDGFSLTFEVRVASTTDFLDIGVERISTTTNGVQTIDACLYSTLRTFRIGNAINTFRLIDETTQTYATHTMIEMRIRATDQLNGVIDNFNCISSSKLRTIISSFDNLSLNLLVNPEDIGSVPWTSSGMTRQDDIGIAPDGTLTAENFIPVASLSTHNIIQSLTVPILNNYTISVFIKSNGYSKVRMYMGGDLSTQCIADLAIGEITSVFNATATITKIYDGWYRITASTLSDIGVGSSISANFQILNDAGDVLYIGDGTSGVLFWGATINIGQEVIDYTTISGLPIFSLPEITDNPAWIYTDVLTGSMNQRPKSYDRLNWNELKRWANFCDTLAEGEGGISTKAHTCNFVLDYSTTIFKLLGDIAAVGRASPDIYDDMYSVIFDEPKTQKVQIFSNMNSSDFSSSRVYTEIPDAVRINFRDPLSDWQMRELIVYNDNKNEFNSTIFEDISSPKTTSSNEAYRNGRYWLKQAALRKESITIKTDLEWLECKRGSYVGFQHDVIKSGGTVARIKSVSGFNVVVDTDPAMNGNVVAWFELRPSSGEIISGYVAYYHVDDKYTVDLGVENIASIGDIIVFNSVAQETYDLLIKQIDVNQDQSATITFVEYAPALYELASDPVPDYNPSIGTIYNPNSIPNKLLYVNISETLVLINKIPYITLTLNYQPDNGIIPSYYNIFKQDENSNWIFQGGTNSLEFKWGDKILAVDNPIIGVQHCFSVVGLSDSGEFMNPALGRQACVIPVGDDTIPAPPDTFLVEDTAENFRRFWWEYTITEEPEDLLGFIIKYTRSTLVDWSSASSLHDGILINPPFEIRALPTGLQTVMIRSIDSTGNLSEEFRSINFAMGDRPVENVLFIKHFAPSWVGNLVSGSGLIDTGVLTTDVSLSDNMWDIDPLVLMYTIDSALMWVSPNPSYKWVENVTVDVGGITTIFAEGNGEVRLFYATGTFPTDFTEVRSLNIEEIFTNFKFDLDNGYWSDFGDPATVIANTDEFATNKFDADTITDNSNSIIQRLGTSATGLSAGLEYFASVYIKKDTDISRFPELKLEYFLGGTDSSISIQLNTQTGAIIVIDQIGLGISGSYGVNDKDDYWHIWVGMTNNNNILFIVSLYPASSTTFGITEITATGSIVACGLGVKEGSVYDARFISDYLYSGAGQGLTPYTSPINLDADDYVVIADSVKSVDVNTLTLLDWVTDVPDINEYFDDLIILATTPDFGNIIIPLTKPFSVVTNVSITLQAGGTATNVRIIDKTNPTQIEIRAETDAGLDASATVDVRVQGY